MNEVPGRERSAQWTSRISTDAEGEPTSVVRAGGSPEGAKGSQGDTGSNRRRSRAHQLAGPDAASGSSLDSPPHGSSAGGASASPVEARAAPARSERADSLVSSSVRIVVTELVAPGHGSVGDRRPCGSRSPGMRSVSGSSRGTRSVSSRAVPSSTSKASSFVPSAIAVSPRRWLAMPWITTTPIRSPSSSVASVSVSRIVPITLSEPAPPEITPTG